MEAQQHQQQQRYSPAPAPAVFYCSLTGAPAADPVVSTTGYVYDRATILQYLTAHGNTCPMTGSSLTPADLHAPFVPAPYVAATSPADASQFLPSDHHTTSPLQAQYTGQLQPQYAGGSALSPMDMAGVRPLSTSPVLVAVPQNGSASPYADASSPGGGAGADLGGGYGGPLHRVPSTASLRSTRQSHRNSFHSGNHRNSWYESTPTEPAVASAPAPAQSVAYNAALADDSALIASLANQDVRYSAALANAGGMTSHDRLLEAAASTSIAYRPWFTMLMTALQVAGLVLSLVVNAQVTGTVIQTTPQFNYLIGPSSEVLIQLGARFAPCMRAIDTLPASLATNVSCVVPGGPADPNNPGYYSCNWDTFCGRLAPTPLTPTTPRAPNQWFRFVLPLFLHGGVIHFAMNIMVQLSSVMSLERDWGWFRVGPVYLVSGVFGFVFGAAFGAPLSPSVGCSGALFGMIACMIIDLVQHWRIVHHPTNALLRILFVVAVTFVIGLFPAIDNFAHIGGFISGGLMGLVVMPTVNLSCCSSVARKAVRSLGRNMGSSGTLAEAGGASGSNPKKIGGSKRGLFGNYSVMSLLVRVAAVVAVGILFAALIPAFYSGSGLVLCPWCRSLDCVSAFGTCSF